MWIIIIIDYEFQFLFTLVKISFNIFCLSLKWRTHELLDRYDDLNVMMIRMIAMNDDLDGDDDNLV